MSEENRYMRLSKAMIKSELKHIRKHERPAHVQGINELEEAMGEDFIGVIVSKKELAKLDEEIRLLEEALAKK